MRETADTSHRPVSNGAETSGLIPQSNAAVPQPPTITLPKGGGAIKGIGEKFAANPVTGTGSMSVPLATSSGRSGFGPQLNLSYDSGAPNGPFGFGWSLALPAITRKTDKGLPQYRDVEESDVFLLSGAEDLVPVLVQNAQGTWNRERVPARTVNGVNYRVDRYRPRIEGLFARIERWTNTTDLTDVFWRSISKDNLTTWYGRTADSRIADPADKRRIFSWLPCQSHDDKGNVIVYGYKTEDSAYVFADASGKSLTKAHERNRTEQSRSAQRYLKRVRYGNHSPYFPLLREDAPWPEPPDAYAPDGSNSWYFEVVFDYGEHDTSTPTPRDTGIWPTRQDPFSSYRSGFEVRTYRICQRILMFHHFPGEAGVERDCLVRSTDLTYSDEVNPNDVRNPVYTFLRSVTQTGYRRTNGDYDQRSLPPIEFHYTDPIVQDVVEEVAPDSLENLPIGLDGSIYRWTDLHGEGIPGMLTEQAGAWFYRRNLSPIPEKQADGRELVKARFAPLEIVALKPGVMLGGGAEFMDLAGDGQPDVVVMDGPNVGLYEHDEAEGWQPFRPFIARLNRDLRDPNLKFVDLDGDGHADVLITENDAFVWHASLAEEGFGPARRVARELDEEQGPRLVFADSTQSIYLADLSGDGLTDIVRIRNGEVCYWPNVGYGRFGAKVTMDNAPWFDHPDQFDHKRIRLADIDGSGTTDIIYVHRDGVRLYFNQSGNSWSQAQTLNVFPRIDDLVSIVAIDLLGNGTACLVWSSPLLDATRRAMRYINLMGSQKPHLLIKTVNNLGAETRVTYAPSTKFYLQDKDVGKPWSTRLPFPVHVVEKVEIIDHISRNRFISSYSYHHGYFDGEEREFRGFGMVEQWDTESFSRFVGAGLFTEMPAVAGEEFHQPPVRTKTWFHTGAFATPASVLHIFEREYYTGDPQAVRLADTLLPSSLTPDEAREASRALKGRILRQEVYADDNSPAHGDPYTVTEYSYRLRTLQPRASNRHAVFWVCNCQTLSSHYERRPADPRVSHELTLETDEFGNVTRSAEVTYPRRFSDPALSADEGAAQQRLLVTCSENRFANRTDEREWYRVGIPIETRTYELTGTAPAQDLFQISELLAAATAATEIPYETVPTPDVLQKRLIEHIRTLYLADDLAGPLPLGQIESRAMTHETLKLALTPGLIAGVYSGRVTDVMLSGEARYIHSEGDTNWWIPSGHAVFALDAPNHFYLPSGYTDPFGNTSSARYDRYDLLLVETSDPLGNRVTVETRDNAGNLIRVENDYRLLRPRLLYDPNSNRSAVAFDALGLVVGTALMGKQGAGEGDSLAGFEPDLDDTTIAAHLQDPLADPHAVLGRATTRLIYDLDAYRRTVAAGTPKPNVVYTLTRETHDADLQAGEQTRIQHSFSYSDGLGREIMKKVQAEPGLAPARDADGVLRCNQNLQPADPRWSGTGRTVFDNKGNVIKQYEPFFSPTHEYEDEDELVECGVTPILRYDPLGRLIRTDEPDGTFSRVEFDAWRQISFDQNDTVRESRWYADRGSPDPAGAEPPDVETRAAWIAAGHANTPTVTHFDTLGRPFLTIADNGADGQYRTRLELDIEGNQRTTIDARDRVVVRRDFDLLATTLRVRSADAGVTLTLVDAGGKTVRSWDSREQQVRLVYDALRRPTRLYTRRGADPERLAERTVYGEAHPDVTDRNLRTRYFQHYDSAGLVTTERNDFKGNAGETARRLAHDYHQAPDWSALDGLDDAALIAAPPAAMLEAALTITTAYDALNRATTITTPDASVVRPAYNEAGLLERVDVRLRGAADAGGQPIWTPFVHDIDYNARGQRTFIHYGSGAATEYTYDDQSFRLVALRTSRPNSFPAGERVAQDLHYTYDPAGNVTTIRDAAQQAIYFNNQVVTATAHYMYDAIYRLTAATGREHIGQVAAPQTTWDDGPRLRQPHPGDSQAMRGYRETYHYDQVGNLLELIHGANNGNWTRTFTYDEPSLLDPAARNNRLSRSSVGGASEPYTYDAHGNMTSMPHLAQMVWDERDRLQQADRGGGGRAWYVYDANGQRVRKVLERQNGTRQEERIYLGSYELHREYDGAGTAVTLERETLHITDDERRIALVETRTQGNDPGPPQLIRYQFANLLGTACLELDDQAQVISYEEFYPFGSTAYQAVRSQVEAPKRYRYTGKERDAETGLYYHGARYYAPWLARWTSADPAGLADGVNVYAYVRNNPVRLADPSGMLSWGQWAGIAAAVVVGTVVTVATAGLAGPVVGTAAAAVIGGIVGGAAGGAVGEITEAAVDRRPITAANVGRAALIGGVAGGVFAGAGVAVSAAARSAAGQAVASRVASSAAAQVVRSTAARAASSAVGQAARRAATRVASSAAGQATRRAVSATASRVSSGLRAVHEAGERLGQRLVGQGEAFEAARAASRTLQQIVSEGPSGGGRTAGAALVDVPGYTGNPTPRALSGGRATPGHSPVPPEGTRTLTTHRVGAIEGGQLVPNPGQGHAGSRALDAEIKILEEIQRGLPPNATGTVHLAASNPSCPSCITSIFEFQANNPGISVVLHAGAPPPLPFPAGGLGAPVGTVGADTGRDTPQHPTLRILEW